MLHYSAPPVVGGVEAVMGAHTELLCRHGYGVTVIAGRGSQEAFPETARFITVPLLDSLHETIKEGSALLETGRVPAGFDTIVDQIAEALAPLLQPIDTLIVHNVFTKHFNLPLTAALYSLLDDGTIRHCIAWSHDFTWTSTSSRDKVYNGAPWDLLRTYRPDVTHVVVSDERRRQLAGLYGCEPASIRVVYNGVDPVVLWGLTPTGRDLIERLRLPEADLIVLMPVRVTQAKNIEYALEVAAALTAQGIDARFVYTGPPDPHDDKSMAYFRSLQQRRSQLGLDEAFRFIYESGPDPGEPYLIDLKQVGELYRAADLLFMPSHREGFGMPILEAGLLGLPVLASRAVPAAVELGGTDVLLFDLAEAPAATAARITERVQDDPRLRLARRVRQRYTWEAIFRNDLEPLLT